MLGTPKLMNGLSSKNLQTTTFYEESWFMHVYAFITVFWVRLLMYTIPMIGIDHYLRIKHCANLKASWTKIVLLVFIL